MAAIRPIGDKTLRRMVSRGLVVEVDDDGVTLRWPRCRRRHRVSFEQVAALTDATSPSSMMREMETQTGRARLAELKPKTRKETAR